MMLSRTRDPPFSASVGILVDAPRTISFHHDSLQVRTAEVYADCTILHALSFTAHRFRVYMPLSIIGFHGYAILTLF